MIGDLFVMLFNVTGLWWRYDCTQHCQEAYWIKLSQQSFISDIFFVSIFPLFRCFCYLIQYLLVQKGLEICLEHEVLMICHPSLLNQFYHSLGTFLSNDAVEYKFRLIQSYKSCCRIWLLGVSSAFFGIDMIDIMLVKY